MPKGIPKDPIRKNRLTDKKLQNQFEIAPEGFYGNCSKCLSYKLLDNINELCMKCWDRQTSTLTKKRFTNVRESNS